uniref:Uncharacterized protein n=1 Tax=viral metagenome TaxID=1070528 RepID=A0A6C0B6T6_9ZZZZ
MPEPTNTQKLQISAFQGLLFYILANPITFRVVDGLSTSVGGPRVFENGIPTGVGLLVHAAVFFAVTLGLMYI